MNNKNKIILPVLLVFVLGAIGLIYSKLSQNKDITDLGVGLSTPTPSTTPEAGTIAMTDVNNLIGKNSTDFSTTPVGQMKTLEGGLQLQDYVIGTGAEAKSGTAVSVHYIGTLQNGTKFDSSVDRGEPFQFGLGQGQVIQGWDLGVVGMRVGGQRKLIIPPALAYGANGVGGVIPPNATLVFMVKLLGVK